MKNKTKKQKEQQVSQIINVFDIHTLQVAHEQGLLFVGSHALVNDETEDNLLITFTSNQIKEMYYYLQSESYKTKLNEIRL